MIADFILSAPGSVQEEIKAGVDYLRAKHAASDSVVLGNYTLYRFGKNIPESTSAKSHQVFVFGFLVYKGKYNQEAAISILAEQNPDWNKAYGNYCIISFITGKPQFYLDPLRKFFVFRNKQTGLISSSFLASLHMAGQLTINKAAFLERLTTGSSIAPKTIFNEIGRLYSTADYDLIANKSFALDTSRKFNNEKEALENQFAVLQNYFADIKEFTATNLTDIGLSMGYDSRLILAAALKNDIQDIQLHTHSINGVGKHAKEQVIVKSIAKAFNLPLKIVETNSFNRLHGDNLQALILDNWTYFDGLSSYNMGSLTETYTRKYKEQVLGQDYNVALNGLGGEIYRNYFNLANKGFDYDLLAQNFFLYKFSEDLVGKEQLQTVIGNLKEEINNRLGIEIKDTIHYKDVRRYVAEMRMVDGYACNHNAHNKISYFLTPFIEPEVYHAAYNIYPYTGITGTFEGKLIERFHPVLARSIPTQYGKSALHTSKKLWLTSFLKASTSQKMIRKKLDYQKNTPNFAAVNIAFKNHIATESEVFRKAWENMAEQIKYVNWDKIHYEFACMVNASMMAMTFYQFRDKIKN
ncbi:MAG: hypothetical protein EOO07_07140 [Chitinophagaceae bacterium]|nr:MAG: hypothetical protein EOO07_07140 [Chitinophagaceae bacterium]